MLPGQLFDFGSPATTAQLVFVDVAGGLLPLTKSADFLQLQLEPPGLAVTTSVGEPARAFATLGAAGLLGTTGEFARPFMTFLDSY